MARAIIRYSLEKGGPQVRIRGRIRQRLRAAGFRPIGTASWEAADLDLGNGLDALRDVLAYAGEGKLDHLWIYVDQPRDIEE
ncbi:MAG TPA: hypothetical protein VFQ85_10265 [Mycobacteriales bacterium]|jgi:hypothetical protein|nr:hypothetical protein [Mycobacteriales bacterium]